MTSNNYTRAKRTIGQLTSWFAYTCTGRPVLTQVWSQHRVYFNINHLALFAYKQVCLSDMKAQCLRGQPPQNCVSSPWLSSCSVGEARGELHIHETLFKPVFIITQKDGNGSISSTDTLAGCSFAGWTLTTGANSGFKDCRPVSTPEKWAWTSRAPLLIGSANLGFDVEVMGKSCGAVWSVIYKLTCLMECGIHTSPTRLGEVHADRWMGEVLVGEI